MGFYASLIEWTEIIELEGQPNSWLEDARSIFTVHSGVLNDSFNNSALALCLTPM